MKRFLGALTASLAGLLLAGAPAHAQMTFPYSRPNYGPGYQPQLSPYLNFLRGGDAASNYFLGTLPEFQRRANAKQFSAAINALNYDLLYQSTVQPVDPLLFQPLGQAGHPTVFNNTLTYFNQMTPVAGLRAPATRPSLAGRFVVWSVRSGGGNLPNRPAAPGQDDGTGHADAQQARDQARRLRAGLRGRTAATASAASSATASAAGRGPSAVGADRGHLGQLLGRVRGAHHVTRCHRRRDRQRQQQRQQRPGRAGGRGRGALLLVGFFAPGPGGSGRGRRPRAHAGYLAGRGVDQQLGAQAAGGGQQAEYSEYRGERRAVPCWLSVHAHVLLSPFREFLSLGLWGWVRRWWATQ